MKAVIIEKYGNISELVEREVPAPEPKPGELLVEIHATGLNPVDFKIRQGHLQELFSVNFPMILGEDVSGVVRKVGEGASDFSVGDEVYFSAPLNLGGGYAEFTTVDQKIVALKPRTLSHVEAASLPLVGLTVIQALRDFSGIKQGHKVMIHAAAGGVGSLAVQYACAIGAEVFATASMQKAGFVRSLGAHHVIDYRNEDFVKVAQLADGMDIVLETIGGEQYLRSIQATKSGGYVPCIVNPPDEATRLEASKRRIKTDFMLLRSDRSDLEELARMVDEDAIHPHVSRVLSFDELQSGHEMLESGRTQGKLVLKVR